MTHRYPGHRSQTPVQQNPYANRSQTPTFSPHHYGPHHLHPHHHGNRQQHPPIHHQFRHPPSHHHHHGSHAHPHHQNYNQPARYGFYAQNPRYQPHGQRYQYDADQGILPAPPFSTASPPQGMFPPSARVAGPSTPHLHQTAFQPRPPTPPLHIAQSRASGPNAVRVPASSQEQHGPRLQSASHRTHQGTLPPKEEPPGRPNETCSSQQPMSVTEQQAEQGFLGQSSVKIPPESTSSSSKKRPKNDEEQNVIIHSSAEDVSTACEHPKSSSPVSPDLVHSENQESRATINQNIVGKRAETEQNLSSVKSKTDSGAAKKRRRKESSKKNEGKSSDKGTVQCSEEQQKELDKQLCDDQMLQQTKKMFPDLLTTTIALPPQSFNSLKIEQDTARPLHVQHETSGSDIGSERAEAKIRRCLEIIKSVSGEAMCILFNYEFDNYLLKAKTPFSRPQDLDKNSQRGDFDVLIVSQKLSCLVMEIKAVGYNTENVKVDVLRKVVEKKAVPQLHKGEMILRHVFKDLVEELEVSKALALPNVRRDLLRTACLEKKEFAQLLRSCLGTETTEEALAKVLCADELPPTPTHTPVTSEQTSSHQALLQWWHHVTQSHPEQNQEDKLEKDVCEKMIARLAGHNSKITVERVGHAAEARTVVQCIYLTGLRFGRDLLRKDQLQILKCQEPFVYLTGTPGSGKTLVLGLKGLEWARGGDHVVVFVPRGVGWGSLISLTLYQRIKAYATQMEGDPFPSVHTATVEKSEDTKKFVRELLNKYSDRPLRILVDEGPTTVKDDHLRYLLRGGANSLENGAQQVRSLEARGTGSASDLTSQLQSARASEQQLEKMKELSSKVQHHLQVISERLQVLQPEHGRPPITQKTWWTDLINRIRESHACIASFNQTLHHHLLTLPESGDPCSDGERSLEGVGSDLNLAEDVAEVSPPAGEPANDSGTQGDVTNVFKAAEDDPCRFGPTADDLHLTQFKGCVHTSSEPTEDASTSEFGKSGPNSDVPDPKFPQSKHCSITDQTDASTSDQSRDIPLQVDQTSRNDTVSTEECLPARSTGLHQNTQLENLGDVEEIPNTSDRQCVSGAEESSRDMDQVLEVLDKLEACMLDGSGKLFNVENQMDFVVLSDILSLLAQEQDPKKLSVWSSGVMPSYKPPGFVQESLKYCLRCPPTVQAVLKLVEKDMADCPNYTYQTSSLEHDDFPLPTDGPEVKLLDHGSHVQKVKDILDCRECGDTLAHYLLHTLAIGDNSGGESGLRAEDVAISGSLDITHREGRPLPFFQALMDQGIPLHFQQEQVASPPPYRDKAFVIGGCPFQGLESKVVVFIPDVSRISPDSSDVKQFRPELPHDWLRNMGRWNRCHLWFVASRCLSQLVVFHV